MSVLPIYLEDFHQNIGDYDIRNPAFFNRFVLSEEEPVVRALNEIYQKNIKGKTSVVQYMQDPSQTEFAANVGTSRLQMQVRKMQDYPWYIKGSDIRTNDQISRIAKDAGYRECGYLLRIAMRQLIQDSVDHSGLSESFYIPEKGYWHIPGAPTRPHDHHYFVLAREVEVSSIKETKDSFLTMSARKVEKLVDHLFSMALQICFVDLNLRNVRLTPDLKQWAILDTEPFQSSDLIFGRLDHSDKKYIKKRVRYAKQSVAEFRKSFEKKAKYAPILEIIDRVAKEKIYQLRKHLDPSYVKKTNYSKLILAKVKLISMIALGILFFFITIPYLLLRRQMALA